LAWLGFAIEEIVSGRNGRKRKRYGRKDKWVKVKGEQIPQGRKGRRQFKRAERGMDRGKAG
jgi:hypothetical protein